MFALIALGMCFVIMTGGIDLSVGVDRGARQRGRGAALALRHCVPGLLGGVGAGLAVGVAQRPRHHPAAASCPSSRRSRPCWRRAARALLLAGNQSVSVSYETGFTELGQGDFLGFPDPGLDRARRLSRSARSSSTSPPSAAPSSPSAATRMRRGSWACRSTG